MIFIECNNDHTFILLLGYNQRQLRHFSKPELIKRVHNDPSEKVTGIFDEDPGSSQPPFLDYFKPISTNDGITLFAHKNKADKYLIMMSPRLEEWLYQRAKLCKIDPKSYELTRDPEELHDRFRVYDKPNFKQFLQDLIDCDNKLINELRYWINHKLH